MITRLIVLLVVMAGSLGPGRSLAADEFETPADESPAASLPAAEVSGDAFHVRDPVRSDGLMHHYVVESRFGTFEAYGQDALRLRLREIATLERIARISPGDVVVDSIVNGVGASAMPMVRVATHPVGTVTGIPRGISHLLGGYRAQAGEIAAQAKKTLAAGGGSDRNDKGEAHDPRLQAVAAREAQRYADHYLGLSAAERRWYAKLNADPYNGNPALHQAVARLAKIDAGASLGMRLAPIGIPFAGQIGRAVDAIYSEDPAVLRQRRHQTLAGYGLTEEEIGHFENALLLTPTRQSLLIEAAGSLDGVEGRAELLRHAAALTSEDEVQVFLASTALLLQFHAHHPVARVLAGPRLPVALTADGHVVVFGAFDAVQWTADVARDERVLRELLPPGATRELWVSGGVSPRARAALEQSGWSVHDHAEGI